MPGENLPGLQTAHAGMLDPVVGKELERDRGGRWEQGR